MDSPVYMKNSYTTRNSCTKHQDKGKKQLAYSPYSALALCKSVGGTKQRTFEHTFVSTTASHSRWASGPDNWILTSVQEVYGVWNLATNYHGAYFLSFIQTSSLFQAPIQAGLAPDCVEETLYFTNIYFS